MRDLPISFSGPMVRAILREIDQPGTGKTQTRRVIRPQPFPVGGPFYRPSPAIAPREWHSVGASGHIANIQMVRFAPGDRLYVREHWRTTLAFEDLAPSQMSGSERLRYEADGFIDARGKSFDHFHAGRFRQAMHMPKWASRITLIVTDVRVERLQDCSEADALAEGVVEFFRGPDRLGWPAAASGEIVAAASDALGGGGPIAMYRDLWDSINAKRGFGWAYNPWVLTATFRVHRGNIDTMGSV